MRKRTIALAALTALLCMPSIAFAGAAPMVGENGTLGSTGDKIACVESRDKLHAMIDAIVRKDDGDYQAAIEGAVIPGAGTRIRVVQREGFPFYLDLKMQLLTGENEGVECWVEADVPGLFR